MVRPRGTRQPNGQNLSISRKQNDRDAEQMFTDRGPYVQCHSCEGVRGKNVCGSSTFTSQPITGKSSVTHVGHGPVARYRQTVQEN